MQRESIYNRMTKSEKEVANVLKEFGIQWSYEQPVFLWDENKRSRVWTPDFYLNQLGIYLEVCGSQHFDYDYRRRIFNMNGYPVIFIHMFKETGQWKGHFLKYLQFFLMNRNDNFYKIFKKYQLIQ
jgi:hypothetical protein